MGHHVEAIPILEKAIKIDNTNLEVIEMLAILYEVASNKDRAEELYQEILIIDPENKNANEGLKRLEELSTNINDNLFS